MKGCKYCTDDTNDIFYERIALLGNTELGIGIDLNVFITDEYELELFCDCEDEVVAKAKTPIAYCPFCGRELRVNEPEMKGKEVLSEMSGLSVSNPYEDHVKKIIFDTPDPNVIAKYEEVRNAKN